MPDTPNKILLLCTPDMVAMLDTIATERATMGARPNRSDAMRWLVEQEAKRRKRARKPETTNA